MEIFSEKWKHLFFCFVFRILFYSGIKKVQHLHLTQKNFYHFFELYFMQDKTSVFTDTGNYNSIPLIFFSFPYILNINTTVFFQTSIFKLLRSVKLMINDELMIN